MPSGNIGEIKDKEKPVIENKEAKPLHQDNQNLQSSGPDIKPDIREKLEKMQGLDKSTPNEIRTNVYKMLEKDIIDKELNIQKPYATNSINELISKEVFTDSGHYVGEVNEVILGENKIDSLKIKLDSSQGFNIEGIIIKYNHVKNIGHVVVINGEVLEKIKLLKV